MKLLLVDDDTDLTDSIVDHLGVSYSIDVSHSAIEALHLWRRNAYFGVIMDWALPDGEGPDIIRRARANGLSTPALLLTGKFSVSDITLGLDSGADDFLSKPFEIQELKARLRAIMRRSQLQVAAANLQVGRVVLDVAAVEAYCGSQRIPLTHKEWQLLEILMRYYPNVVTKDMILSQVWDYTSSVSDNAIEVYIRNLRSKIDRAFQYPFIRTIRGLGYKLQPGYAEAAYSTQP